MILSIMPILNVLLEDEVSVMSSTLRMQQPPQYTATAKCNFHNMQVNVVKDALAPFCGLFSAMAVLGGNPG